MDELTLVLDALSAELLKQVKKKGDGLKHVILNSEAINYIDSSAAHMLKQLITDLKEKGITFKWARVNGPTRDILYTSGLIQHIGEENLFVRTFEACDHCRGVSSKSDIQKKISIQSKKILRTEKEHKYPPNTRNPNRKERV